MDDWSGQRKKWTTARDKYGVKKGLSSVSIGDAIDKVAKAMTKGYNPVLKALDALESDLTKYQAALVKAKLPKDLANWIDKNLITDIADLRKSVEADLEQLAWLETEVLTATVYSVVTAQPDLHKIKNALRLMKETPPATWSEAAKDVGVFDRSQKVVPVVRKQAKDVAALSWTLSLKSFAGTYAAIKGLSADMHDDLDYIAAWINAPSDAQSLNFLRDSAKRTWSPFRHEKLRKDIKVMVG